MTNPVAKAFDGIGNYSKTLVGLAGALTIYFNTYWATAKWEPTVIAGLAAVGVLLVPNQKDTSLAPVVQLGRPGSVTITAAGGGAGGSAGGNTVLGGGGGGAGGTVVPGSGAGGSASAPG